MEASCPAISLSSVGLNYGHGEKSTSALQGVDAEFSAGEFACIQGPSGSGKTSLLLLIGGMLRPTSGDVLVGGQAIYDMDAATRSRVRAERIGFVFQMFHLIPYLDLVGNVLLAGGDGASSGDRRSEALALLDRVGLAHRAHHYPSELSAGERQRAAIGRSLFHEPSVLLADEPTGNLDPENTTLVLDLLSDFHATGGTVLLVTHGRSGDERADSNYSLIDGCLARVSGA